MILAFLAVPIHRYHQMFRTLLRDVVLPTVGSTSISNTKAMLHLIGFICFDSTEIVLYIMCFVSFAHCYTQNAQELAVRLGDILICHPVIHLYIHTFTF